MAPLHDDSFARWAAPFVDAFERHTDQGQVTPKYAGVTPEACELLESVDAGGVPAFISSQMLAIALENGIAVLEHWSPAEVVAALRDKALCTVNND